MKNTTTLFKFTISPSPTLLRSLLHQSISSAILLPPPHSSLLTLQPCSAQMDPLNPRTLQCDHSLGVYVPQIPEVPTPPLIYDWRWRGAYLGDIWQQGKFGTCWAIAPTNCLDIYRRGKGLIKDVDYLLSPQEIINYYSKQSQTGTVDGYSVELAAKYIVDYGIPDTRFCEYVGILEHGDFRIQHECKERHIPMLSYAFYDPSHIWWHNIRFWDPYLLYIITTTPIVMTFNVGNAFPSVRNGIYSSDTEREFFYEKKTGQRIAVTSHAMVVVGYGNDEVTNQPYWLVKNSHGLAWGVGGYGRILRSHVDNLVTSVLVPHYATEPIHL